jgi:hypothetical protein
MGWQPISQNRGGTLSQWRHWWRPGRLRLAGSEAGREVALGRLGNAAHPSGESGQGGPHSKNALHGDVWSARGEWRGGGGRVLRREDIRHSHGAQDGVDEVRGGLTRAGIAEALSGERHSFGRTLRRHCFDNATGLAGAGRWRRCLIDGSATRQCAWRLSS